MSAHPTSSDRWSAVWSVPQPGKSAAERHFAVLALGVVQALREGQMTVEEAWNSGLNLKTYLQLKQRRADPRLLELWEWAMELPQVTKLTPLALEESLTAMDTLARGILSRRQGRSWGRRAKALRKHEKLAAPRYLATGT